MDVDIRIATSAADLEQAAAIHYACLLGNNDDRNGGGWVPLDADDDSPREVVLVAVVDDVVGYAWGDENVDGIAVCQEVAVRSACRRRGVATKLLRDFGRHAGIEWSSEWIYLRPLESPWLLDFYRRLGFVDDSTESGYLRVNAEQLTHGG